MKYKTELIAYLENRIQEIQRIAPLLELYGVSRTTPAEQIWALGFVLEQVKEGKSKEQIITLMRSRARLDGTGTHNFYRDIEHVLETGKPMLPESIFDIPAYLQEERRKIVEKEREERREIQRKATEERERAEAEKKRQKQEAVIDRLGLKDVIAGLRAK